MNNFIKLIHILIALCILPFSFTLFTNSQTNNFTLSSFAYPPQFIVLDGLGSQFIAWNDKGQIAISSTNGSSLCNSSYNFTIGEVIWPGNYDPIILLDDGSLFMTISTSTCKPKQYFSLATFTQDGQSGQYISFKFINSIPTLAVSGILAVYEIDLSKPALSNLYTPQDPSYPINLVTSYSKNASSIYVTMIDRKTAVSTVRVWNISQKAGNYTKAINYNLTFVLDMKPSRDNTTMITSGVAADNSTKIHTFDSSGTLTQKISIPKQVANSIISDTNLFDSVMILDPQSKSLQVIKIQDGKNMQNLTISGTKNLAAFDYNGRTLAIVDNSSLVLVYTYKDDSSPDPKPTPTPDDDGAMPLWGYIVIGACGLIVVSVIVVMVCRRNMNGKKSGVYRNFSDEV